MKFNDAVLEEMGDVMCDALERLCELADKHGFNRDVFIENFVQRFKLACDCATFENYRKEQ